MAINFSLRTRKQFFILVFTEANKIHFMPKENLSGDIDLAGTFLILNANKMMTVKFYVICFIFNLFLSLVSYCSNCHLTQSLVNVICTFF